MATPTEAPADRAAHRLPIQFEDMPILYEDEDEGDLGEADYHVDSDQILHQGIKAHLQGSSRRVFSNMNCYYLKGPPHKRTGSLPYVSPDNMVVEPDRDLGALVVSYTIGEDGPPPLLVGEVLSKRSAQQNDLKKKLVIYAKLGIAEYILVDVTGKFLKQRLLLKRLQTNRKWTDESDADGGVTSRLGFRLIIDSDGRLRAVNAATGVPYPRPDEAATEAAARRSAEKKLRAADRRLQAETAARLEAEEQLRKLQAELDRLRGKSE